MPNRSAACSVMLAAVRSGLRQSGSVNSRIGGAIRSYIWPAGALAPVCAELMADGGPQVVAYVLGTEGDPQVYSRQRATLEEVGCLVPETNARAAYAAGALALRRPELAEGDSRTP